jgi:hypothetical protein
MVLLINSSMYYITVFVHCDEIYHNNTFLCRLAQEHGIWAWDQKYEEPVLVLPFVLAMLGDNPMQSEFACHIGMRGKFFCRVCKVKGSDALDEPVATAAPLATPASAPPSPVISERELPIHAMSDAESVPGSNASAESGQGKLVKRGKKAVESLANMVRRVGDFIKVLFTV